MTGHLIIRNAAPEDASFIAWLLLASGRAHVQKGVWEVILGLPEDDCLEFFRLLALTKSPHLFHHSCYLLAELEGRPVAGLGGHDPAALGIQVLPQVLPPVLAKTKQNPLSEMLAGAPPPRIVECIPPAAEGVWAIDSVATLPEFRRRGLVDRLLIEMIQRGRSRGFKRSQINLYIGNLPAERAYEKQGYRVTDEYPDPYFEREIGCPGMMRMFREI